MVAHAFFGSMFLEIAIRIAGPSLSIVWLHYRSKSSNSADESMRHTKAASVPSFEQTSTLTFWMISCWKRKKERNWSLDERSIRSPFRSTSAVWLSSIGSSRSLRWTSTSDAFVTKAFFIVSKASLHRVQLRVSFSIGGKTNWQRTECGYSNEAFYVRWEFPSRDSSRLLRDFWALLHRTFSIGHRYLVDPRRNHMKSEWGWADGDSFTNDRTNAINSLIESSTDCVHWKLNLYLLYSTIRCCVPYPFQEVVRTDGEEIRQSGSKKNSVRQWSSDQARDCYVPPVSRQYVCDVWSHRYIVCICSCPRIKLELRITEHWRWLTSLIAKSSKNDSRFGHRPNKRHKTSPSYEWEKACSDRSSQETPTKSCTTDCKRRVLSCSIMA